MKILFICNNMPPMVDGVGDYTYNIASEFARHGHETHVICRKRNEIRTDCGHLKVVPMVEAWNRATGKRIAQYVNDNKIDVVSLQYVPHGFHPKGLPFGLIPCMKEVKKTGVKMMVFCHEVRICGPLVSLKNLVMQQATKLVTGMLLREFKYVATSIEYYAGLIKEIDKKIQAKVMPIVSNVPFVKMPVDSIREFRRKVAKDDELIVAFFGLRNIDTSIDALEKVHEDGYRIKVLFIGKLPSNFRYENLKNSYKTGVLDIEELGKYLHIPDILILPEQSFSGCSFKSGSLAAAMQNGIAVVTGKGELTSASLVDGENILFANFDDVDDIYRKVKSLCHDTSFRLGIGKGAAELLADRNWENTFEGYINLFLK